MKERVKERVGEREMSANSTSYEVASYTIALLVLWLAVRLIASSMNSLLDFFREPPLKVNPFINGVEYPVSYWTEKGRRPYQEDRYHCMKSVSSSLSNSSGGSSKPGRTLCMYGVFDGHGGSKAAQQCKENLLNYIASDPTWETNPEQAISSAFIK